MKYFISAIMLTLIIGCSESRLDIVNACSTNPAFEISELKFGFDLANIQKIDILSVNKASASLTFPNKWLPELMIITTDEQQATGGIESRGGFEKLGVNSLLEIYQKAKQGVFTDEYSQKVIKAMGVVDPNQIQIIEKQTAHVIVLPDAYGEPVDNVYVIRENDPRIMMLSANMNAEQTDRLLGNICL